MREKNNDLRKNSVDTKRGMYQARKGRVCCRKTAEGEAGR